MYTTSLHLVVSAYLILATKLPILGIILYSKGINPRSLIGTIGTHLQRDAPRWCKEVVYVGIQARSVLVATKSNHTKSGRI